MPNQKRKIRDVDASVTASQSGADQFTLLDDMVKFAAVQL
jgi:hypothetical protein